MKFEQFISRLEDLRNVPLGGLEAQFKLAPKMRLKYDTQKIEASNPKLAAVLALFYPNEQAETTLLLTKRASYKGTHSAQISFPGGKIEEGDSSLFDTALRETYEEVGVAKDQVTQLRQMTDVFIPPSNFLVAPFIGFTQEKPKFVLNEEVAEIIEVTLSDLLDDAHIDSVLMNTSYMKQIEVPCFRLNQHIVWGATGMMLSEIKEMLK